MAEKLKKSNSVAGKETLEYIRKYKYDASLLNTLKFLVPLVSSGQSKATVFNVWKSFYFTAEDIIELNEKARVTLLMHLLVAAHVGTKLPVDERIPYIDSMINIIDTAVMKDLFSYDDQIISSGYMSISIKEILLNPLSYPAVESLYHEMIHETLMRNNNKNTGNNKTSKAHGMEGLLHGSFINKLSAFMKLSMNALKHEAVEMLISFLLYPNVNVKVSAINAFLSLLTQNPTCKFMIELAKQVITALQWDVSNMKVNSRVMALYDKVIELCPKLTPLIKTILLNQRKLYFKMMNILTFDNIAIIPIPRAKYIDTYYINKLQCQISDPTNWLLRYISLRTFEKMCVLYPTLITVENIMNFTYSLSTSENDLDLKLIADTIFKSVTQARPELVCESLSVMMGRVRDENTAAVGNVHDHIRGSRAQEFPKYYSRDNLDEETEKMISSWNQDELNEYVMDTQNDTLISIQNMQSMNSDPVKNPYLTKFHAVMDPNINKKNYCEMSDEEMVPEMSVPESSVDVVVRRIPEDSDNVTDTSSVETMDMFLNSNTPYPRVRRDIVMIFQIRSCSDTSEDDYSFLCTSVFGSIVLKAMSKTTPHLINRNHLEKMLIILNKNNGRARARTLQIYTIILPYVKDLLSKDFLDSIVTQLFYGFFYPLGKSLQPVLCLYKDEEDDENDPRAYHRYGTGDKNSVLVRYTASKALLGLLDHRFDLLTQKHVDYLAEALQREGRRSAACKVMLSVFTTLHRRAPHYIKDCYISEYVCGELGGVGSGMFGSLKVTPVSCAAHDNRSRPTCSPGGWLAVSSVNNTDMSYGNRLTFDTDRAIVSASVHVPGYVDNNADSLVHDHVTDHDDNDDINSANVKAVEMHERTACSIHENADVNLDQNRNSEAPMSSKQIDNIACADAKNICDELSHSDPERTEAALDFLISSITNGSYSATNALVAILINMSENNIQIERHSNLPKKSLQLIKLLCPMKPDLFTDLILTLDDHHPASMIICISLCGCYLPDFDISRLKDKFKYAILRIEADDNITSEYNHNEYVDEIDDGNHMEFIGLYLSLCVPKSIHSINMISLLYEEDDMIRNIVTVMFMAILDNKDCVAEMTPLYILSLLKYDHLSVRRGCITSRAILVLDKILSHQLNDNLFEHIVHNWETLLCISPMEACNFFKKLLKIVITDKFLTESREKFVVNCIFHMDLSLVVVAGECIILDGEAIAYWNDDMNCATKTTTISVNSNNNVENNIDDDDAGMENIVNAGTSQISSNNPCCEFIHTVVTNLVKMRASIRPLPRSASNITESALMNHNIMNASSSPGVIPNNNFNMGMQMRTHVLDDETYTILTGMSLGTENNNNMNSNSYTSYAKDFYMAWKARLISFVTCGHLL